MAPKYDVNNLVLVVLESRTASTLGSVGGKMRKQGKVGNHLHSQYCVVVMKRQSVIFGTLIRGLSIKLRKLGMDERPKITIV